MEGWAVFASSFSWHFKKSLLNAWYVPKVHGKRKVTCVWSFSLFLRTCTFAKKALWLKTQPTVWYGCLVGTPWSYLHSTDTWERERDGAGLKDRTDLVLLAFAPIIIVNQSNSKKMQTVCGVRMATEDRMTSFFLLCLIPSDKHSGTTFNSLTSPQISFPRKLWLEEKCWESPPKCGCCQTSWCRHKRTRPDRSRATNCKEEQCAPHCPKQVRKQNWERPKIIVNISNQPGCSDQSQHLKNSLYKFWTVFTRDSSQWWKICPLLRLSRGYLDVFLG